MARLPRLDRDRGWVRVGRLTSVGDDVLAGWEGSSEGLGEGDQPALSGAVGSVDSVLSE